MTTIHVATRKGLFQVTRADGRWAVARASFLGDPVTMVLPDARDGALYATLSHGHFGVKLHRSDDGGATWQEVAAPQFPPRPDDATDVTADGKPWPWRVEQVWSLEAVGASELWCGTLGGGLFRSADRGASWSLVRALWDHPMRPRWFGGGADQPAIHSICAHPRDPNDVLVAVSCGGAWRTRDGGETWAVASQGMFAEFMPPERRDDPVIQDPHRVAQCRDKPERLWCQHHNGVFRSDDRGTSWTEVKDVPPSVFGFGVAAHPSDPDTAWFVPAAKDERRIPVDGNVVVARTRDGARRFDVLREGLPQGHAYDLTLRHALDVDATGTLLAFGSTTGSLWVSDDGGDRWAHVSAHLPPVYAVRVA